jgi:hypothetical protein
MNNLVGSFLPVIVGVLLWFAPIALIYKVAKDSRKNTSHVLLGGLLLGWIGAAVVALILPRMSDAEWAAFSGGKPKGEPWGELAIVMGGIGVCAVAALLFMAYLAWVV